MVWCGSKHGAKHLQNRSGTVLIHLWRWFPAVLDHRHSVSPVANACREIITALPCGTCVLNQRTLKHHKIMSLCQVACCCFPIVYFWVDLCKVCSGFLAHWSTSDLRRKKHMMNDRVEGIRSQGHHLQHCSYPGRHVDQQAKRRRIRKVLGEQFCSNKLQNS